MPTLSVELPIKEYRITNGPPEKILMFTVFEDIERAAPPPYFTIADETGKEHRIYVDIQLAGRDIAHQHDFDRSGACYYLAGMKSSALDFLGSNFWFVAIYSVSTRTGRWLVVPEGALPFVLPGNYILRFLDREEHVPTPLEVLPEQTPGELANSTTR